MKLFVIFVPKVKAGFKRNRLFYAKCFFIV
ncbi:hypothetical protein LI6934_10695 [Bacillus licheniformis LMG 6934]|nr:hypothetical protein LI6934_10695 [Bacillus licheniformis LMG 6934]